MSPPNLRNLLPFATSYPFYAIISLKLSSFLYTREFLDANDSHLPKQTLENLSHPRYLFFKFFCLFYFPYIHGCACGLSLARKGRGCSPVAGRRHLIQVASLVKGSRVQAPELRCRGWVQRACGVCAHQGSNPCPLHWQAGSYPLHHLASPTPES